MTTLSTELLERCESKCELCSSKKELQTHIVSPKTGNQLDEQVALCSVCKEELDKQEGWDANHWRCLNESIWSPFPPVQVIAYRMLKKLSDQNWAQDLMGMMYMEDETKEWAMMEEAEVVHKDSNGNILQNGDTVTLIKDLNVKGANFTAKRGTAVRRIRLVPDNAEHIEGKVEGQQIVILTQYVKK